MDFLTLFKGWLGIFSISFVLLPMFQVREWRRRGTAEGFSSVQLVIAVLTVACWLKHSIMMGDTTSKIIKSINICCFVFYISAYAFYQPQRRYLIGQLTALAVTILTLFTYVESQEPSQAANVMGRIAAGMQIVGLGGGLYEIYRVIKLKHTEYVVAKIHFAVFFLFAQWVLFGILTGNAHLVVAHLAGLFVNVITLSMFVVYPPLTWRVPIFGTGPQLKKTE